uniref:ADP-dependent glucokinase n=1 Tax=Glossina morsitans morsitans TaxID=37546 RepID=A0A1B0FJP7_GLOMM
MDITMLKYMGFLTTCSVFAALTSIVWQAFLSLKHLNKLTTILTGLLAIEKSLNRDWSAPNFRVAIGYGACTDLVINATEFLNYTDQIPKQLNQEFTVDEVNDETELLETFAYYFQKGAAAERTIPNSTLFRNLIRKAKRGHHGNIQWQIGGNAPLMGIRFRKEGWDVLLGAHMSYKLRRLVPKDIRIAGDEVLEDDIHLILEYKAGETWGPFTAPRANRYILHNDQTNPYLRSLENLEKAVKDYQPHLIVISGLQMMDSYKFEKGVRESRLLKVMQQLTNALPQTLLHFEMASYVEIELLQQLKQYVLPYVDSLGMNEQELENLAQVLEFGRTTLASDCNPRLAPTLDKMRKILRMLAFDYYKYTTKTDKTKRRLLTRIHLHTLAYQALMTVSNSNWKNTRLAVAKAALMANRYVCQMDTINPEASSLILDESFSTSLNKTKAQRINFNPQNPVACWIETLEIEEMKRSIEINICVSPVLVCRVAKKTAGAGDNISAAALSQQF